MIYTAIIMGLAGSLHCIGMCSPLVLSVTNMSSKAIRNRLVYNAGRILTYTLLGIIFGSVGWMLPISKFQNFVSITLGLVFIVIALSGTSKIKIPVLTSLFNLLNVKLRILFQQVLRNKNLLTTFILGLLNGILPCGLTLLALTYTITLNNPLLGGYYMLLFGLGTLPVMLGLTTVIPEFTRRLNINLSTITTTMFVLSGCLLLARVFIFGHAHTTPEEQHFVDIVLCR